MEGPTNSEMNATDWLQNFSVWLQQYYQLPPAAQAFARATFSRDAAAQEKANNAIVGGGGQTSTLLPDAMLDVLGNVQNKTVETTTMKKSDRIPPALLSPERRMSLRRNKAAAGDDVDTSVSIGKKPPDESIQQPRGIIATVDQKKTRSKKSVSFDLMEDGEGKAAALIETTPTKKMKKKEFDANIVAYLESKFEMSPDLSKERLDEMVRYLGVDGEKIETWFQQKCVEKPSAVVEDASPSTLCTCVVPKPDFQENETVEQAKADEPVKKAPSRRSAKSYADFTADESARLEKEFQRCREPSLSERKRIARDLESAPRRIDLWFSNRLMMAKFAVFSHGTNTATPPTAELESSKKSKVSKRG